MKNLLIAQSGGPTAAINASLAGVVKGALVSQQVNHIYGAMNGIEGVFGEKFVDLREAFTSTADLERLCQTPSSALGSCRFHLKSWKEDEKQYIDFIHVMRKYSISYFVYIGGNDSMDTVYKLSEYCKEMNIEDIIVVGVPKTIDNDLAQTDHCPGFGSAAKYIATTFAELERDISVYNIPAVTIVEVMGRNAGWLTAASALSRVNGGNGPDFIYLCEREFDIDEFICTLKTAIKKKPSLLIAVSEGIKDKNGEYISATTQTDTVDAFGHKYISGTGKILENIVRERIGCKARSIELNLMQRCAAHIASDTDIQEANMLGLKALQCALEGQTGIMSTILRVSSIPYHVTYSFVPVELVANHEKKVPLELIQENGYDVTEEMMEYILPLIQGEVNVRYKNGIPQHVCLMR